MAIMQAGYVIAPYTGIYDSVNSSRQVVLAWLGQNAVKDNSHQSADLCMGATSEGTMFQTCMNADEVLPFRTVYGYMNP